MQRHQIPDELGKTLDEILKKAGTTYREGKVFEAIELGHKAWAMIPEPKEEWDFYPQTIVTGLVKRYSASKDLASFRHWIAEMHRVYDDKDKLNAYVNLIEGKNLFDLDAKDDAFNVFDGVYNRDGRDWFKGEYKPYLDWYLKERARRRG